MTFQSHLLNKINHVEEAPLNAYILYDINGGIFWIDPTNYKNFILQWIGASKLPSLTMDLSSTCTHSIILDFDYVSQISIKYFFTLIENILKMTLLPIVSNFTYIIALRKNSKGIHIHLPEFKIGNDDYILFCESLQYKFKEVMAENECYKLDILTNAMLCGAAKPNTSPYFPTRIVYVDERKTFCLNVFDPDKQSIEQVKKTFTKRTNNKNSLFRNLLNCDSHLLTCQIKQYMMPVMVTNPIYTLMYATTIGKTCNNLSDWQDIATFIYKKSKERGFIRKCNSLVANKNYSLATYQFLKLNSKNIEQLETNNHALKMWLKRFSCNNLSQDCIIPNFFLDVHEMLKFEHTMLTNDPNPIQTIMQFNDGYYFLPVFYALCKHYDIDSISIAKNLYSVLDKTFHPLLDKLCSINPKIIQSSLTDITINTLHFCANNLCTKQPKLYREKLKSIVENNKLLILTVTTQDQLIDLIRNIQNRHLPIRKLKLKNALKKPVRYIWNALSECWQEIYQTSEISDHISNLWNYIKQFIIEYQASGGLGGPDEDLVNKFNVSIVVSAIMSDTSMELKDIQMDTHKWLLRLQDGVLDLLTDHIGGVVPEFFLSDRQINIHISRKEMIKLCTESPQYVELYEKLTDEKFFFKYLQDLFLDTSDNLFDTLCNLLNESEKNDNLSKSMLHFYINLCKCTCYEYDMLMYLLDILASVYIGTNYERKFFVWKGLTRNGKSKMFELMGRVLGTYYYSIQSENLTPSHSTNNPTPELASTLFSCRMITSEELEKKLNENRVKQITGNSFVTFRNMYEQNSGGIPTAKLFASTNNYPECKASEAFKDRVVAIPFDAEFTDNAPKLTSEQVGTNTYKKEVYVVEQSFMGCFFMLYYHLKKCMTLDDGLLHYRSEPEYIIEFTRDYLVHADIYVLFKIHMDVQEIPGTMTTMNELTSAIRQYLKMTKNTSFHESDLFYSFDLEFGHLRQSDIYMGNESFSYTMDNSSKKAKTEDETTVVFYDGIVIKNLKKINLDV